MSEDRGQDSSLGRTEGDEPSMPDEIVDALRGVYARPPGGVEGLDQHVRAGVAAELARIAGSGEPLREAKAIPLHRRPFVVGLGGLAAAAMVGVVVWIGLTPAGTGGREVATAPREPESSDAEAGAILELTLERASGQPGVLGDELERFGAEPAESLGFADAAPLAARRAQARGSGATLDARDINGDGRVDVLDAYRVARGVRDSAAEAGWDVSGDGLVDLVDAEQLLAFAVRLAPLVGGREGVTR